MDSEVVESNELNPEKLLERGRRPGDFGVKFGRGIGGDPFGGEVFNLAASTTVLSAFCATVFSIVGFSLPSEDNEGRGTLELAALGATPGLTNGAGIRPETGWVDGRLGGEPWKLGLLNFEPPPPIGGKIAPLGAVDLPFPASRGGRSTLNM